MNPKTQPLIDAHLAHVIEEIKKPEVIGAEVQALLDWFRQMTIGQLIPKEALKATLNRIITENPVQPGFIDEISEIILSAMSSISKHERTLGKTLDEEHIKNLVHKIATQDKIRGAIFEKIFANPTYANMLSQTITQAVEGYLQNNAITKKVPGMGGLMKMGKGLLEKATDTNLDDALQQYLNKNINHLIQVSENMANKHLSNEAVETFLLKTWNKLKDRPLREKDILKATPYIKNGTNFTAKNWDLLRQRQHFRTIFNEGIEAWYDRHQSEPLTKILSDLNITDTGIQHFIQEIVSPIINHTIQSGHAAKRIRPLLASFYESAIAQKILNDA